MYASGKKSEGAEAVIRVPLTSQLEQGLSFVRTGVAFFSGLLLQISEVGIVTVMCKLWALSSTCPIDNAGLHVHHPINRIL
jgi:hypothetical protein